YRPIPMPATQRLRSIAKLRPMAAGKGMANQVNGEKGADWSFAKRGLPDSAHESHSGICPCFQEAATSSCQGRNCVTGSPTSTLRGKCEPAACVHGRLHAYRTAAP